MGLIYEYDSNQRMIVRLFILLEFGSLYTAIVFNQNLRVPAVTYHPGLHLRCLLHYSICIVRKYITAKMMKTCQCNLHEELNRKM